MYMAVFDRKEQSSPMTHTSIPLLSLDNYEIQVENIYKTMILFILQCSISFGVTFFTDKVKI